MSLRILFVTPYVPSMVRIRPLAFIRELARLGHRVTLACLVQPDWEYKYLSEVRPYCENVYPVRVRREEAYQHVAASLFSRTPLSVAYCDSAHFKGLVKSLMAKTSFDMLHTEFIRAAPATLPLNTIPKIFDAVDSITLSNQRSKSSPHVPIKQRMVAWFEWFKMRRYEPWVIKQYDRTIVSSPIDRDVLRSGNKEIEVIPNGVDLDYFCFHEQPRAELRLMFLGKLSYHVNVSSVLWFYHQIFPLIRRQYPNVRFQIVGRNPVPALSELSNDPCVDVTGTVPDVRPHLANATLSICPMVSGSGIQNKMLEAMAVGTPCVSTSLACQALSVKNGREVMIADTPEAFADAVCKLLADPICRRQVARLGRNYVENCHNWQLIGHRLEGAYQQLLAENTH